ncbi:MAG: CbiX/SirB N-terminal domain-containing protein [Mycobacteriales bacterium]
MTVLLGVAHGSRDDASQQVVHELLSKAAALRPGLQTAAAFVDNASPSIRTAVADLVAGGARRIAVVPLLLTPASHSKTDIAASVQQARAASVQVVYGRPLGPHPTLVDVLARRLSEAGAGDEPVLLVAGGALDPDANAQVAATARLLFEGRGFASVDVAFASTARPSVPEALERLARQGCSRVALARYFLGPGRLPQLVEQASAGYGVLLTEPLGAADEIATLVLERYDEALVGDIRMNCDACLHRVPFRGHQQAVGAPQRPHAHPDDV